MTTIAIVDGVLYTDSRTTYTDKRGEEGAYPFNGRYIQRYISHRGYY